MMFEGIHFKKSSRKCNKVSYKLESYAVFDLNEHTFSKFLR